MTEEYTSARRYPRVRGRRPARVRPPHSRARERHRRRRVGVTMGATVVDAPESERLLAKTRRGSGSGSSSSSFDVGATSTSSVGAQHHRSASKIAAASASGSKHKNVRKRRMEIGLAIGVAIALAGTGRYVWIHGAPDVLAINPAQVHDAMDKAGILGVLLWCVGFCLAELCHLPATVFIITGVLRWGHFIGFALALVIAPLSCALSFIVVRRIGGQALANVQWRFVQRMMARLERKPVVTVVILRTFLFLSPSLNYALALSNLSFRNFIIGSTIGLVFPMSVVVLGIDHLIKFYGWSRADVVAQAMVTAATR
mmetsp:Transcript_8647/g.28516  ORF Transcript_8647/g.28516 Transcript_8647/m.28516 type:complete len:313 (+) Transcript_8647:846-1784(+)